MNITHNIPQTAGGLAVVLLGLVYIPFNVLERL